MYYRYKYKYYNIQFSVFHYTVISKFRIFRAVTMIYIFFMCAECKLIKGLRFNPLLFFYTKVCKLRNIYIYMCVCVCVCVFSRADIIGNTGSLYLMCHRSVHLKYIRWVQPKRCDASQFIYFCKTLYMFQTGFPSVIRSSKLHIQRQVFVRPILLPAASLARLAAGSR